MPRNRTDYQKQFEKPQPRAVEKISPRFYKDNLDECRTYSLNKKYGGEYQTFLKELVDAALKDRRLLKRMGVIDEK